MPSSFQKEKLNQHPGQGTKTHGNIKESIAQAQKDDEGYMRRPCLFCRNLLLTLGIPVR
jgi:hypothetical protein